MRKITREVIGRWMNGRKGGTCGRSWWTDGESLHSYGTCICTTGFGGVVILNRTAYSPTTDEKQHALRAALGHFGVNTYDGIIELWHQPLGVSRPELIELAEARTTPKQRGRMRQQMRQRGIFLGAEAGAEPKKLSHTA